MFSDFSGPEISLSSNKQNNNKDEFNNYEEQENINNNIEKNDIGVNTIKTESKDESTQLTVKDLLQSESIKNYDQKKLTNFLNNAYSLINDVLLLRRDEFFLTLEDNDLNNQNFKYKSLLKFPSLIINEQNKNYKVSDMAFSKNGTILSISYFINDHIAPCSHLGLIIFYKFENLLNLTEENLYLKNYSEKIEVETNSCIKCIEPHPTINNIFVAGSYNGELLYINLGNKDSGKEYIEFSSKIDSMFYKECIINLRFVKFEDNIYYIVSISNEGRILVWNIPDQFKYPVIGFNLKFKVDRITLTINPTFFINSPFENFDFLLGSYDGNIYKVNFNKPNEENAGKQDYLFLEKNGVVWRKNTRIFVSNMKEKEITEMKNIIESICRDKEIINLDMEEFIKLKYDVNKIYKNALKANYEKHFSFISSISFNYFIKNLFLTTSYDGSLRLYKGDSKGMKFFYEKIAKDKNNEKDFCYYTYATWSPYKPSLFVSGNNKGEVNFEVITSKNTTKNILNFCNNGNNCSIVKICFNPNNLGKNIMCISYSDGLIELIYLSDEFSNVGNSEIEKLLKIK